MFKASSKLCVTNACLIMFKINDIYLTDIPSSMHKFLKVIAGGLSGCVEISTACVQFEANGK